MSTQPVRLKGVAKRPGVAVEPPAFAHGSVAPVLDRTESKTAEWLTAAVGRAHPVRTFLAGIVLAYVSISGLSILLGLLVTRVILADQGIAGGDEGFVRFLTHHRTGDLTEASLIGSIMAGGVVLPIIVAVCGVAAAAFRQWRVGAFLILALALESAAYRTTTLVVHRERPTVPRLEHLPVDASYPSGHTAAAIAVYGGLALLLTSRLRSRSARLAIWAAAVTLPVYVAFARMYRGMHHPLDVLGGVVIGIVAVVAMVLVCRAAGRVVPGRYGD
jgi:membrane-associated phospholipid phosphatase